MSKLAFIGLGVMGMPMAGHLSRAGHDVAVFNRSPEKAAAWAKSCTGRVADSPADAASGADFVFACVGNDDDVRAIALGDDGAFSAMPAGAMFVDHTTTSATLAREIAGHAHERGIECLDAPVSGGQQGAQNGKLTVMCGGTKSAFDRAQPLIMHYARACVLMGETGHGQLTKMVNQICIAGLLQGLAEGLNFAARAKLDANLVIEVIGQGAAQSWQMDNRGATMVADEFDFGFAVDWMRKDLGIALEAARGNGAPLPVTALVNEFYAQLQGRGGNRDDTSSLIRLLQA